MIYNMNNIIIGSIIAVILCPIISGQVSCFFAVIVYSIPLSKTFRSWKKGCKDEDCDVWGHHTVFESFAFF